MKQTFEDYLKQARKDFAEETMKFSLGSINGKDTVLNWLLQNGFSKCYGMKDYDCVKRIHVIHSLYWSDNLNHFAIGVLNESGKKGAAGRVENIHYTLIPKPIYTIDEAKRLIDGIT